MITGIPFSGFYNSMHEGQIDNAIEVLFQDDRGDSNPDLMDRFVSGDCMDYNKVQMKYVKMYTKLFKAMFNEETGLNIPITFNDMQSPREYNFTTDRIFARISKDSVKQMFGYCDKTKLDEQAKASFTSYDGFSSFYSSNWKTWGEVTEWDHNQLKCLVEASLLTAWDKDKFSACRDWEWKLIEETYEDVDCFVYDGLTKEGKRLSNIAYYLLRREDRKYDTRKVA